jgi:hypothetical protein
MFKKFIITILMIISLLGNFYLYSSNIKLKENNSKFQNKITYYENIIKDFEADELIEFPQLYSEGYVEQIKVHSCMWAFDVCICE